MSGSIRLNSDALLAILNLSKDATAIYTGADIVVQMANDVMINYWGKDRSIIGKPLLQAVPELEGQPFVALLQHVWSSGKTHEARDTAAELKIDGKLQTFYFDFIYRALLNHQGETYAILHTATDVTESVQNRHALEEVRMAEVARTRALRESELNLRLVIQQAPVAIAIFRGPQYITDIANHHALTLWGRREDEVLHLPILAAMPELKAQGIDELLDAVYHRGEKFYYTERPVDLRRGDHLETLYLNFSYEPLYDADGIINGLITIGTNVTEQVNARLALARTEEMLRFSVDAAGAATWHMDIATRSFVFSDGMKGLYGFRPEEEPSYDDMLARVPADYQKILKVQVEQTIAHGSPYLNEHPVTMPDGRERWIRSIGKRYPAEGNWGAHISGLVIDITDEKLKDMRKSGFIGMASHELKTPLTSLSAIIQVAGLKLKDSEDVFLKGAMERANNQVKRMTAMINGFLNISRLESGKLIIDKETFDLEALMRDIADEISLTATNHEIELDLCGYLGIRADRDKIGSVISNLLSNAVKYSPPGTTIQLRCRIEGKYVQISVRDEGMGIDAIDIKRLFDRYYRVESSRTKHISGFGIGLYLCSEIIKQHGGKIWAESILGQGSTFYFTLPLIG